MAASFQRSHALSAALSAPDPVAGHRQPMPLPESPEHPPATLGPSLVGSLLLSPGSWCICVLFVPSKSLFPQSCISSLIKSHWLPKSNSWGLPDPEVGKSVVVPSTVLTVLELLWYNCSALCGPSALRLYGGVNGDLLQEGLCHTQVCCTQSPCCSPL